MRALTALSLLTLVIGTHGAARASEVLAAGVGMSNAAKATLLVVFGEPVLKLPTP